MISHLYPWASTSVLGGTRWCYRARPLPDVYGGALGEASGTVYFHFREQGRPQGASFSAGDLSLLSRDSSSSQFGHRVYFDQTAGAAILKRAPATPPAASGDATDPSPDHLPVLLDAVLAAMMPVDGAVYVDGTFGAGGYSAALLAAAQCRVVGIDRDPAAVRGAATL